MNDDRPVQVWFQYNDWLSMEGWIHINFDDLEPGMIVRFDHNDDYIHSVMSYPFLSSKYSFNNEPVMTIIVNEFLYWPENN